MGGSRETSFPVPGAFCFIYQSISLPNFLVNQIQVKHSINHSTSSPLQALSLCVTAFTAAPEATDIPDVDAQLSSFSLLV